VIRTRARGLFGLQGAPSPAFLEGQIEQDTLLQTTLIKQNDEFQIYSFNRHLSRDELAQALSQMQGIDGVSEIFEDAVAQPFLSPDDPYYASQPYYGLEKGGINLAEAWNITTGSPDIRVAILDTGRTDHPDLAGRWLGGFDFVDANFSNDGDGWDPDPSDPGDSQLLANASWHGTHVAGIIAGLGNNRLGIAGVNWQSPVIPVRVLGKGGGYVTDIADAIRWAAGVHVSRKDVPDNPYPARVLNLSLGVQMSCDSYTQQAINDAYAAGAIIVVAAGNWNRDTKDVTPAGCQNVIAAASNDNLLPDKSTFSDYGETVTISAPGNSIYSTIYNGATPTYGYKTGTSMSSPHIAGVISLILSVNPSLTFQDIRAILRQTAVPFPANANWACQQGLCGAGIVNAAAAVQAAQSYIPPSATGTQDAPPPISTATVIPLPLPPIPTPTPDPLPPEIDDDSSPLLDNQQGIVLVMISNRFLQNIRIFIGPWIYTDVRQDRMDSTHLQITIPGNNLATGEYPVMVCWGDDSCASSGKSLRVEGGATRLYFPVIPHR
jgi:serine protease